MVESIRLVVWYGLCTLPAYYCYGELIVDHMFFQKVDVMTVLYFHKTVMR